MYMRYRILQRYLYITPPIITDKNVANANKPIIMTATYDLHLDARWSRSVIILSKVIVTSSDVTNLYMLYPTMFALCWINQCRNSWLLHSYASELFCKFIENLEWSFSLASSLRRTPIFNVWILLISRLICNKCGNVFILTSKCSILYISWML